MCAIFLSSLSFFLSLSISATFLASGHETCSCSDKGKVEIDLKSFEKTGSGSKSYYEAASTEDVTWLYNPCGVIDEASCQQTSLCRRRANSSVSTFTSIETKDCAFLPLFGGTPLTAAILYVNTNGKKDNVYVVPYCSGQHSSSPSMEVTQSENGQSVLLLCSGVKSSHHQLSIGSILLIVSFSLLALYIFGGMIYLKVQRGATGKELLPNYDFWLSVPGLIKDGILFLLLTIMCKRHNEGYSSI